MAANGLRLCTLGYVSPAPRMSTIMLPFKNILSDPVQIRKASREPSGEKIDTHYRDI